MFCRFGWFDASRPVAVISNQSGIGRGKVSPAKVRHINQHIQSYLKKRGVSLRRIYICPHLPAAGCPCRKPNTGMIRQAVREYHIDIKKSFVVGDKLLDVAAGKNSGAKGILVLTGNGRRELKKAAWQSVLHAATLAAAARMILRLCGR